MATTSNIFGFVLNGRGGAETSTNYVEDWRNPQDKTIWLDIDTPDGADANSHLQWLYDESGLDDSVLDSLTAEETRPRFYQYGNGLLVILRGLNIAAPEDEGDTLSVRVWLEPNRIITIQRDPSVSIGDIKTDLAHGQGPNNSGDFLAALADYLTQHMSDLLDKIEDDTDDLEDKLLAGQAINLRQDIAAIRRLIIRIRRYLAPQKEVLLNLQLLKLPWISDANHFDLREIADRITRYLENLESCRERAVVANDELDGHQGEQFNRTIFLLSIVAAIFLPLTLLTGLLGINVAGIPGAEYKYAFWLVCLVMLVIAFLLYWIFKKKRLL